MASINNPKRFLWQTYNGSHEEEITSIKKFMSCSSDYEVQYKCKRCGAERKRSFVSHEELLESGITNEIIEIAKHKTWKR